MKKSFPARVKFWCPWMFMSLFILLASNPHAFPGPLTIWPTNAVPQVISDPSTSSREMGVKFRSAVDGYVTAIRFYKGPNNTGTHTGRLWTSNGTQLAVTTFTNESASGWQQRFLTNAVAISSNTTYIASYYAPSGRFSVNTNYFTTQGVTNFPLRALATGESGSNGVFRLNSSGFPTNSVQSSHYWVDLVFATSINGTDSTAPTITTISPAPGTATNLSAVTVTFSELVTGVDASDFRLNGLPATNVTGGGRVFTFHFPPVPYGPQVADWLPAHGISDLASPFNHFDHTASNASWEYGYVDAVPPAATVHPPAGLAIRSLSQIEVTFSEDVTGVDAADLLVNGQPATNLLLQAGPVHVFQFPEPPPGTVTVAWATGHGIADLAVPPNAFAGGNWFYTLDPDLPPTDLQITEILAANISTNGLADEDGEQQDWIEIHNRGTNVMDLTGWSLSDDAAVPGLWPFPARSLAPGQFLLVFASGKDRRPTATNEALHTNFQLSRRGESLGLYTPDAPRKLASGFTPFPEQRNDVSYGLDPLDQLRYFTTPTPGATNGFSTVVGVVEPVHANVARGHFDAPFTLILTCPTPGTTIRYTTDGAEPIATSTVFPGNLLITNTTLLRAAGFKPDHLPSRTTTHTYLFNFSEEMRSLPTISIVTATNHLWGPSGILGINGGAYDNNGYWYVQNPATDYHNPQKRGPAWERPTSVEWIEPGDYSGFQADCGIRVSGSDYRRPRITPTSKVSFRLYFRGDYGEGRLDYPLFPLTSVQRFDQIVLRSGFDDQNDPFVRDELHRRLAHDTGQPAAHGTLGVLFINGVPHTNSPYFNPCERVHEDFFQEHYRSQSRWDVVGQMDSVIDGARTDFNSLVTYVSNNNATVESVYTNIARRLDLTNFVDYLMVNTYGSVGDWPRSNWRAAREQAPGALWRFAIWDAEYGMGLNERTINYNTFTLSGSDDKTGGLASGGSEIALMYQKLRPAAEFKVLWSDRVQKHFFNGGALTIANITNRIEELRRQLEPLLPVMDEEFRTWALYRQPIYFSQMAGQSLLMSRGAPSFNQHGGRIPAGFNLTMTHTNAAGSIYFTTDGTDPRVPFSAAIAPTATLYTNPVPLNTSVTVKARVRDGSNWSALAEATFTYAALGQPVCISELMYNPPGGNLYEFIELFNPSATAVNLGGCYFNGVTFVFPLGSVIAPGARLVLGNNSSTNDWKLRYPDATPFGWFGGNLNNAGERLELFAPDGTLITSVDYSDTAGWPKAADGGGKSLELIDPAGDPDAPANWQASAADNGTPGAPNSAPPVTTVILNELQTDNLTTVTNGGTNPDWIELHNTTATPVSLANWSLTDDGNERQYVFPTGTTLPANGFLTVWCDSATNAPGLHTGFALSKNGETISLFNASTTRVDAVSFGLQLTDFSLGRIGGTWTLTMPTLNAPNLAVTLAAQTNLALNEWLANSLPGQPDWIELFNRSANLPVSLEGLYFATSNSLFQLRAKSYLAPLSFVQLLADRGVGPASLDFTLGAGGDRIALHDATGGLIEEVSFGAQAEALSAGRLPDGTSNVISFPGTASPGASNYVATYTGPVLNEVLARNRTFNLGGFHSDFVELRHPGPGTFDLGGMSLGVDEARPGQWVFPPGTLLAAGEHLLLTCDSSRPASTNAGSFNLSNSLNGSSGGVWLFNAAGQLVDSVQYGFQIEDHSIGLSSGQWRLLATPTPGAANAAPAALGTNTALRLNEWMPLIPGNDDWFELFNPASLPVDLATVSLTDDPSLIGKGKFRPAPLSFIAANGFVQWVASGSAGKGFNHVNFVLNAAGESLLLYAAGSNQFNLVDAVAFGAQTNGVSQGRLPDGAAAIVPFPGSPTPAASNYRLLTNIVFSELLTHTDPPYEDAVELQNVSGEALDIGRWYLSNNGENRRKYQFAPGTVLTNGGFLVAYQYQFDNHPTNGFALSSVYGEELWLSAADASGNETGDRLPVSVGPAFNGISFGRVPTTTGVDYAPLISPTFGVSNPGSLAAFRTGTGAPNTAPRISPVVLNEILYHPPGGTNSDVEFIELHNRTAGPVPLFHPTATTNTWRLADGTAFTFPTNVTLPGGGYALIVSFDPATNTPALDDFRARYVISTNVPIFGPLLGGLNNTTDDLGLYQPDNPQTPPAPDAGYVPYIRVDRVNYRNTTPWPIGLVSGGGHSLQRAAPTLYGNEALNWFSAPPTPGAANPKPDADTDNDGIPDAVELLMGLNPFDPEDAALDNDHDGASNYEEYIAGTNHEDPASRLHLTAAFIAGKIVLTFEAVSNRTYTVLSRETIPGTNWVRLADVPAQPVSQAVSVTNAPGLAERYFRVATPALP